MEDVAVRLWKARMSGKLVTFSPEERPKTEAEAYAVQWRAIRHSGRAILGWKIGATNPPVQKKMGTSGPISGPLQEGFVFPSPWSTKLFVENFCHIETEIALRLGEDIPKRAKPYTPDELNDAVAAVHPAFELVGSRVEGGVPKSHGMTLIPDFAGQTAFTYGPAVTDWRRLDLAAETARILVNGGSRGEGTGILALGHPMNVLAWLANTLSGQEGASLKKGHFVSTGTLTGLTPIQPGDVCVGKFEHLGEVRFTFEAAA
jgi:2-keto-4-pentenoate hydratase